MNAGKLELLVGAEETGFAAGVGDGPAKTDERLPAGGVGTGDQVGGIGDSNVIDGSVQRAIGVDRHRREDDVGYGGKVDIGGRHTRLFPTGVIARYPKAGVDCETLQK